MAGYHWAGLDEELQARLQSDPWTKSIKSYERGKKIKKAKDTAVRTAKNLLGGAAKAPSAVGNFIADSVTSTLKSDLELAKGAGRFLEHGSEAGINQMFGSEGEKYTTKLGRTDVGRLNSTADLLGGAAGFMTSLEAGGGAGVSNVVGTKLAQKLGSKVAKGALTTALEVSGRPIYNGVADTAEKLGTKLLTRTAIEGAKGVTNSAVLNAQKALGGVKVTPKEFARDAVSLGAQSMVGAGVRGAMYGKLVQKVTELGYPAQTADYIIANSPVWKKVLTEGIAGGISGAAGVVASAPLYEGGVKQAAKQAGPEIVGNAVMDMLGSIMGMRRPAEERPDTVTEYIPRLTDNGISRESDNTVIPKRTTGEAKRYTVKSGNIGNRIQPQETMPTQSDSRLEEEITPQWVQLPSVIDKPIPRASKTGTLLQSKEVQAEKEFQLPSAKIRQGQSTEPRQEVLDAEPETEPIDKQKRTIFKEQAKATDTDKLQTYYKKILQSNKVKSPEVMDAFYALHEELKGRNALPTPVVANTKADYRVFDGDNYSVDQNTDGTYSVWDKEHPLQGWVEYPNNEDVSNAIGHPIKPVKQADAARKERLLKIAKELEAKKNQTVEIQYPTHNPNKPRPSSKEEIIDTIIDYEKYRFDKAVNMIEQGKRVVEALQYLKRGLIESNGGMDYVTINRRGDIELLDDEFKVADTIPYEEIIKRFNPDLLERAKTEREQFDIHGGNNPEPSVPPVAEQKPPEPLAIKTVYHPKTHEPLEVIDDTDKSMYTVRNSNGTELKIGKQVVLNTLPGEKSETVSVKPAPKVEVSKPTPVEVKAPEENKPSQEQIPSETIHNKPMTTTNKGVLVNHNTEKNSIEVRFDTKPSWQTLGELKKRGFRWSQQRKVWYAPHSDSRMEFANSISGVESVEKSKTESKEAPKDNPVATNSAITVLRRQADILQKTIDSKRNPATANQNPTARRANIINGMAQEADRLETYQMAMRALADAHEDGTISDTLKGVTTRGQIEALLRMNYPSPGTHKTHLLDILKATEKVKGTAADRKILSRAIDRVDDSYVRLSDEEIAAGKRLAKIAESKDSMTKLAVRWFNEGVADYQKLSKAGITDSYQWEQAKKELQTMLQPKPRETDVQRQIKEAERKLIGTKIDGYFPTPKPLVDRMLEEADIMPGDKVLEPSAGKGNIADAIKEKNPDADLSTIEVVPTLRDLLELKGHKLVGSDFLEVSSSGNGYDKIVMNPPFEKGQDIDHVRHAYDLLNPGGKVVAIMSEGPFFRSDKKSQEFRAWLDSVGGTSEKNPEGAFKSSERSTGVATRLVVIEKPAEKAVTSNSKPSELNNKTWYHGTKSIINSDKDIDLLTFSDTSSLFGPGFYMTDDPSVAGSYSRNKGKGTEQNVYKIKAVIGKVIDLEAPVTKDYVQALKDGSYEQFKTVIENAAKKPGATNQDVYKTLSDAISEDSHENQTSKWEYDEMFDIIRENLRKKGYDALTHTGGIRVGDKKHTVLILLDPTNQLAVDGKQVITEWDRLPEGKPAKAQAETATKNKTTYQPPEDYSRNQSMVDRIESRWAEGIESRIVKLGKEWEVKSLTKDNPNETYKVVFKTKKEAMDFAERNYKTVLMEYDGSNYKPKVSIGNSTIVKTSAGTEVKVTYAVYDAKDLLSSDQVGYPKELQPRDRARVASEQQISKISNTLDPDRLGENILSTDGAPIIGKDRAVESGNGRVMAIRKAYESKLPTAEAYKKWIWKNKEKFGLDSVGLTGIDNPVLVRINQSEVDRVRFAEESNSPSVSAMSATEQAKVDANKLTGGIMRIFAPDEDGNLLTGTNREFVRQFLGGIVNPSERAKYMTSDGTISQEGLTRIRNAVFAKAYEDTSAIERLSEEVDSNVKNITTAMLITAPKLAEIKEAGKNGTMFDMDLTPEITAAVTKLSALRNQNEPVSTYLKKLSMFDDELSPEARRVLQVLDSFSKSRKKLTELFRAYAESVEALGNPNQGSLFGEKIIPTKAEVLEAAIKLAERRIVGEQGEKGNLFPSESKTLGSEQDSVRGSKPPEKEETPRLAEVEKDLADKVDNIKPEETIPVGMSVKILHNGSPYPGKATVESPYAYPDADREQAWKDSHGVKKMTFKEKIAELKDLLYRRWTREFEYLPHTKEFAQVRFDLLKLQKYRDIASDKTLRNLYGIVIDFNPAEMDLFERAVALRGLKADVEKGLELPFGWTPETYAADAERIESFVESNPKVKDALDQRQRLWKAVDGDYIEVMKDIGFDVSDRFQNEDYHHHMVLAYAQAKGSPAGAGREIHTPKGRGFLRKREGTSLNFNTNYLEAEHEVFAQMLYDIQVAKTIKRIDEDHNIIRKLKGQARDHNEDAIRAYFLQLVRSGGVQLSFSGDKEMDEVDAAEHLYRQMLNKKQAIGFTRLKELAIKGELDGGPDGRFDGAIDALKAAKETEMELSDVFEGEGWGKRTVRAGGDESFMPFISYLASLDGDTPGNAEARMIFKGMAEKKKYIQDALGANFKTWEDFIPEGYDTYQPDKGNVFFMATSVPEKLAKRIMESELGELIGADALKKVMVMGGAKQEYVIPTEIKQTLESFGKIREDSTFSKVLIRPWKIWQLTSPNRVIKYNLRNLSSDLEAVLDFKPAALRRVPQAAHELLQVVKGDRSMTSDMRDWFERGGMQTVLQVQEVGDINSLRMFEHLQQSKGSVKEIPTRLIQGYWKAARVSTDFREAILRYATYLEFLNDLKANKGKVKNYGASIPEEVDGLSDVRDKAFTLSNDAIGAYDKVSHLGQEIRQNLMPFWSFQEVNMKRYWQYFKNASRDKKISEAVGRKFVGTITKSPIIAARVGGALIKILGATLALQVYNMLLFGDEEKELSDDTRKKAHIILGRNPDGSVRVFDNVGMLSDFLGWFGIEDATGNITDFFNNRKNLRTTLLDMAKAPAQKILGGSMPLPRLAFETLTKKSLYPDTFNPSDFRDRGLHVAQGLGVDDEYRRVFGMPTRPLSYKMKNTLYKSEDPDENAYYHILDLKYEYLTSIGKGNKGSFGDTDKSRALYHYKTALKYRDRDAAKKYLQEYFISGGTQEGLQRSLNTMEPLYGLGDNKGKFLYTLNEEDRQKLLQANRYYYQSRAVR